MKRFIIALIHFDRLTMRRSMTVVVIMAAALFLGGGTQAQAAVTINFDNFSATPTGTPYPLNFLADYGIPNITIGGATGAGGPLIIDTTSYFGFIEPSPPNIFRQDGAVINDNTPNWLEFHFSPELASFTLTRIGFNLGRSMPRWQATFYDAEGNPLGGFGEPYLCCNSPPLDFTFSDPSGTTIAKMRLTSWHTASTFRNIGVDDFVLAPADSDGDGVNDDVDNCPDVDNPGQSNIDSDEVGDLCDDCPADYDNQCNPDGSAAESIGQGGGTVSTPDENVEINIPEGALPDDTTISITDNGSDFTLTTNLGQGQAVFGVDIGPSGTLFEEPVVINFSWEDGDNDGKVDGTNIKETRLRISKDGVVITGLCSEDPGCNMDLNTFTVTVTSLSEFVLVYVDDEGPVVESVTVTPNPVPVGQYVVLSAVIDDTETGGSNIVSAEYSFDGQDWIPLAENNGVYSEIIPAQTTPGVFGLYTRGTDEQDNVGDPGYTYLVVYDPEGGFVTGGGWIWSPTGAYGADSALEGKAHFGFVSKYKKGAEVPTGETEFKFEIGNLYFYSNTYEWLVVAGAKAKYKGTGTVNGGGEYKFMLTAIDAKINENDNFDVDRFRIKIWEEINGAENVIYDNGVNLDECEGCEGTTELSGGSIVIHKSKK